MDIRGDRRLQLQHDNEPDERNGRRLHELDNSFASTCQVVRANKDVCVFGCGKLLAPRTIDYHRLKGCRGKQVDAFADESSACYEESITREGFFQHLNTEHDEETSVREEYVYTEDETFEHDNEPDERNGRRLHELDNSFASTCQVVRANKDICVFGCGKLLAPRTIDYHRLNGCRGKQDDAFADVSRKRSFTCGACYEESITREGFFQHLNTEHAVEASIREYVFPDFETFERFRFWLEAQGGAHFRQKSGAKTRPTGKGIFMMCNRSGLVHTTAATGLTDKDKLGSYRMGYTCTAFINGTIYTDGHVSIRYCGDHYGHDARVRLPQSIKNIIMHMQAVGRPNSLIIRYLQDHFIPLGHESIHAQRAAYVDLEELRSITPMLRKLAEIPYNREEEWEQEFLETAGVVRDWAPAPRERPDGWLPIKELAEQKNWAPPLVFKAKVRNSAGDWMVYDEHRQVYVLETTTSSRSKLQVQHYLDDLEELEEHYEEVQQQQQQPKEDRRVDRGGRRERGAVTITVERGDEGAGEEPDEEVDVEDLRENEEMPQPGPSTSSASASAATTTTPSGAKKRRLEEREGGVGGRRGGNDRAAIMEEEQEEQRHEEEVPMVASSSGAPPRPSGFLASSILAELEMIKALVKAESEFLSEAEMVAYLRQTRALRLSFEPLSRGTRSTVGQKEFAVPQLTRHSRSLTSRGRSRVGPLRVLEPRSALFAGSSWGQSSASPSLHQKRANGDSLIVDPHEIEVCEEEEIVEERSTATGRGVGRGVDPAKIQYNSRLWS